MSRTLVLLKPDTVRRGLMGKVITRFENTGLKIRDMKMFDPPHRDIILKHYESSEIWLTEVGSKTIKNYIDAGYTLNDVERDYGVSDENGIGRKVKERLVQYLSTGVVVAMVIEGNMAVEKVRSLVGGTMPAQASPGTIRGDFGIDTAMSAASEGRSIENLVHASDSNENAEKEIYLWFGNG